MSQQIDKLDKKILKLIASDARIPFLEVARECNVSGAAIHQRVQKLTSMGVIKGSEFVLNTYMLDYQTCAFIGIMLTNSSYFKSVSKALEAIPQIVECHATTGKYSMFVKVYAQDNRHLMHLLIDKMQAIPGVSHTETFQISLDEMFHRQLSVFDDEEEEGTDK